MTGSNRPRAVLRCVSRNGVDSPRVSTPATSRITYLDDSDLADQFVAYLHQVFAGRPYAKVYQLYAGVATSSTTTAEKGKAAHSPLVREFIGSGAGQ